MVKKGHQIEEFNEQLHEASELVASAELDAGDGVAKNQNHASEMSDADRARRNEFLRKRAKKEAKRGEAQLTKDRRGFLAVQQEAVINNRYVASSFLRFLHRLSLPFLLHSVAKVVF